MSRSKRSRPSLEIPPLPTAPPSIDLDDKCEMNLNGEHYTVRTNELNRITELGRGAYGVVETMKHTQSGFIMAVKRIQHATDGYSKKQSLVELEASMKSGRCPFMVTFYGAMFSEGEIWLCMEVMNTSLDKLYKMVVDLEMSFPENVLARIAYSIIEALHYMKEELRMLHRDVKPSNILANRMGSVKLCDFGISGQLRDSVAKTIQAGCKPYMAPERVDPKSANKEAYDVRSDIWSLGISVVELATGAHPYSKWKTPFQQLKQVVDEDPPSLPQRNQFSRIDFSEEMHHFVNQCLQKNHTLRPKYLRLLQEKWILIGKETRSEAVATFITSVIPKIEDQDFAQTVLKDLSSGNFENEDEPMEMDMPSSGDI